MSAQNGTLECVDGAGEFAVVIPTRNRSTLVVRAIESVYATRWRGVEVIVVDDASEDGTPEIVSAQFPEARLLRIPKNSGPGAARNLGILATGARWAVMLDDDDLLEPEALQRIHNVLEETAEAKRYPVIQFARTDAVLSSPSLVARLQDYVDGGLRGDFTSVVQPQMFRERHLQYPTVLIGGEHLLWYGIAAAWGIPTWRLTIVEATSDARSRLCSIESQLTRAREYAELLELTLERFGEALLRASPAFYRKKALGVFTYRLLAGDRGEARDFICNSPAFGVLEHRALWCLSCLPQGLVRKMFEIYRHAG